MATDQYAVGYVFIDGQLLAEELNVDIDFQTGNQIVTTQYKGFAGVSPGAKRTMITVKNAIPKSGLEYNAYDAAKNNTPVEFVIFAAGNKRTSTGFIMNVKESFGVDTPSSIDFDFEGDPLEYT